MREPVAPCKGCTDRVVECPEKGTHDCHQKCQKYNDFLVKRKEWIIAVGKARAQDRVAGGRPWLHKHSRKEIRQRGRHDE